MTKSPDADLKELVSIARKAADLVLGIYTTKIEVELKGPNDPVTRADREANELIVAYLQKSFPGELVVAEESADAMLGGANESPWSSEHHERVFFVDPLDGTKEFIDRNGEFAVMIGLAQRGRAEFGAIVMPATSRAIYGRASVPGSAVLEEADGSARSICVSAQNSPAHTRMLVSRSHRPAFVDTVAQRLGTTSLIPCGSVGVKVSRIATGEADLYLHGSGGAKLWDICAPEAILHAAGGQFTDLSGAAHNYRNPDLVVRKGIAASNKKLHTSALAAAAGLHF